VSGKLIIMAGLALTFGATSYVGGNYYLESQTQALTQARIDELESNRPIIKQVEFAKLVVAADVERRAMATIYPGEPIMTVKISGDNGKSGLAGLIGEGMRAVTIPVNQVAGVGGFIQPGDRVDVVHTYTSNNTNEPSAEIIMQNVKVLSVDQDAVSRTETARIANSVTLETDTNGARIIAKSLNVGDLSLLLRGVGDNAKTDAEIQEDGGLLNFADNKPKTTSIKVVAGNEVTNFTVEIEQAENKKNNKKSN